MACVKPKVVFATHVQKSVVYFNASKKERTTQVKIILIINVDASGYISRKELCVLPPLHVFHWSSSWVCRVFSEFLVMADQEETFAVQNSPVGSDSRELQSDNKPEKQNGTSSKSPSSQTTYIQQVRVRFFVLLGPLSDSFKRFTPVFSSSFFFFVCLL